MTATTIERPFRVRQVKSGCYYNGVKTYIVVMLRKGQPASRVSVHAYVTRESAQANADQSFC